MQEQGEATYFVAWRGAEPCGRVTLFHRSKYEEVLERLGVLPEMNALEATPRGRGIGSQVIAAAEDHARAMGFSRLGLAVEHSNVGARRLCERLGYVEWPHGEVVDQWVERSASGEIVQEHADACSYLVKRLTS